MTMHFLLGLVFLILIIGLACFYVITVYLFVSWLGHVRRKRKAKKQGHKNELDLFWCQNRIRRVVLMALLVSVSCTSIYVYERLKWMGSDNANLKAKEYYVAGQVLNGLRAIATNIVHPDLFFMQPANGLQWRIYRQGVKSLPSNDGETGAWQNQWFHYHYSKKHRKAWGALGHKPSLKMIKLLDQWWFCLEAMATKPFADRQMEEELYYQGFHSLALSYRAYRGFYSGKLIGSAQRMAMMPEHVERIRLLSDRLWELPRKWKNSVFMKDLLKKQMKVEVLRQMTLLLLLKELIQGEIHALEFSCTNESVKRYIQARKEFVNPTHGKAAYLKMREKEQAQRMYRIAIEGTGARSTKYVIKQYCGVVVAGKENNSELVRWAKNHNRTPAEQAEENSKDNYMQEIEILERIFR